MSVLVSRQLCVALALMSAGCDGWEFSDQPGEFAKDRPFALSVLDSDACPLPDGVDEKKMRIVGVKVRLTGGHPGGVPANYFYASVLTTDGERYLAEQAGCGPNLKGPPLRPGEAREGFLNFPLPVEKQLDHVVYAPNLEKTEGFAALSPSTLTVEAKLP